MILEQVDHASLSHHAGVLKHCNIQYLGYQLFLCFATIAKYHTKGFVPLLAETQVPADSAASNGRWR